GVYLAQEVGALMGRGALLLVALSANEAVGEPITLSKFFDMKSAELSLRQHDPFLCAFSATPTGQSIRTEL
ncbi:hypothetical protein, partial [Pseudomonas syringae group genomosp. 7]|uniref:hypothetical protein n=1 Tax=Pseudomonas syringae group genomosp. 7 TaxID=251699 RepID=UPI00376FCC3E